MNIALIGYGKMGKAIEATALERGHQVPLKIDISNQQDFTAENLKKADVAIEFTGPHSAKENILKLLAAGIPIVSGSTGWLKDWAEVENVCKQKDGTLLYASNFSVGVNIFFEINRQLAKLMDKQQEYEVTMEEIHHTEKRDAPSGTAISLAEQIIENLGRKKVWVNHQEVKKDEIAIVSQRIDPAPGTHIVKYSSAIDDIEIIHTAHSRKGFATGAVLAAEFVKGKKGIFAMKDVLGI